MTLDAGLTCMIVLYDRRGSKYQNRGPVGEVVHDAVSNGKQRSLKIEVFGKSSDGNVVANSV